MKIYSMYFSPTDTTKKVVLTVAEGLRRSLNGDLAEYDFTLPDKRDDCPRFGKEDIVVFGVPTYAGRVPNVLLPYIQSIKGNGAKAIALVTYGNRNFDDSLIELSNILRENKFKLVAAGAFVAEHSFSKILAAGRPDEKDAEEIKTFAQGVGEKIKGGNPCTFFEIMGETPLRPYYTPRDRKGVAVNILRVKPKVNLDLCDHCGICGRVCPMGSIDKEDISKYTGICIKCGACEKLCPKGARYYDDENYLYHKKELEEGYKRRGKNYTFL